MRCPAGNPVNANSPSQSPTTGGAVGTRSPSDPEAPGGQPVVTNVVSHDDVGRAIYGGLEHELVVRSASGPTRIRAGARSSPASSPGPPSRRAAPRPTRRWGAALRRCLQRRCLQRRCLQRRCLQRRCEWTGSLVASYRWSCSSAVTSVNFSQTACAMRIRSKGSRWCIGNATAARV